MPKATIGLAAALAVVMLPGALLAEAPHRQLGAHQHGHGKLSIAIEDGKVEMELEAPGADIVGFEHAARTPDEKATLEAARAALHEGGALFKLPEAAGCRQVAVDVDMTGEHDRSHGGGGEAADHDTHGHGEPAVEDQAHAGGHSETHVSYGLACSAPAEIKTIVFDYFRRFPNARELEVEVVTGRGASRFEVTRDKPELDLTGLM